MCYLHTETLTATYLTQPCKRRESVIRLPFEIGKNFRVEVFETSGGELICFKEKWPICIGSYDIPASAVLMVFVVTLEDY